LMFIEVVEFDSIHARELFASILPQIVEVVQCTLGEEREQLRPIPLLMLIRSFFGLFFSYFLTEIIFAEASPPEFRENAVDYMIDIFLHGVLKESETTED
jgi:hypothetical protein